MSKLETIQNILTFKYKNSQRELFSLKEESYIPMAQAALETIKAHNQSLPMPANVKVLKNEDRRFVFRITSDCTGSGPKTFILKVFPFNHLRHKIQYYWKRHSQSRFGFGEASALLTAAKRGLNVPEVYGHGRINDIFGQIKTDMILMQDINNHTEIGKLLETNHKDQAKCVEILNHVTPIFVKLYEASCNNIDMNLGAIMLANTPEHSNYVLDFEYSKFHEKPSLKILMSEAGHFANRCRAYLTEETVNWWFSELMQAIKIEDASTKKHLRDHFNFYSKNKLSRKKRMKLY